MESYCGRCTEEEEIRLIYIIYCRSLWLIGNRCLNQHGLVKGECWGLVSESQL